MTIVWSISLKCYFDNLGHKATTCCFSSPHGDASQVHLHWPVWEGKLVWQEHFVDGFLLLHFSFLQEDKDFNQKCAEQLDSFLRHGDHTVRTLWPLASGQVFTLLDHEFPQWKVLHFHQWHDQYCLFGRNALNRIVTCQTPIRKKKASQVLRKSGC